MKTSHLLKAKNLHVAYDQTPIVKDISFTIEHQNICSFVGPSGGGKTTLLRTLAGFEPLTQGSIELNGELIAHEKQQKPPEIRQMGMVFQDYALFPHLTVAQNIRFGLKRDLDRHQYRVQELLELVNLEALAHRYPHELSGGQQQRVALARALAPNPLLLLMDEPFSNLDNDLRRKLSLEVKAILKYKKISAILVTHDQQEAFSFADYVGVLANGELMQWDTPYQVYHKPSNRFVADFIGQGHFISGMAIDAHQVKTDLGMIRSEQAHGFNQASELDILIRPDDIEIDPNSEIKAVVVSQSFIGAMTLYILELQNGKQVSAMLPSHNQFYPGETMALGLNTTHLVAFAKSENS